MNIKSWFESKTVWLAILQALVGVVTAIVAVDPALKTTGLGLFVKSFYDIYLRLTTSTVIQ